MVQVTKHYLRPTNLIPNNRYPLLHYRGLGHWTGSGKEKLGDVHKLYENNGWKTHWIFRYGPTQMSHYHSHAHECMTVLTGTARIRFGVADTSSDLEENTYGDAFEAGGVEVEVRPGDVFLIPAGVAHKTYNTTRSEFALLTPGNGKGVEAEDPVKALNEIELSGFTMMGCYPFGADWDFVEAASDKKEFEESWKVPRPLRDPVMGTSMEGLLGLWKDEGERAKSKL